MVDCLFFFPLTSRWALTTLSWSFLLRLFDDAIPCQKWPLWSCGWYWAFWLVNRNILRSDWPLAIPSTLTFLPVSFLFFVFCSCRNPLHHKINILETTQKPAQVQRINSTAPFSSGKEMKCQPRADLQLKPLCYCIHMNSSRAAKFATKEFLFNVLKLASGKSSRKRDVTGYQPGDARR